MRLILATQSPYKQAQMRLLKIPFLAESPDVKEDHSLDLSPEKLSIFLAEQKAKALLKAHPNHLVIGSDQTATFTDEATILTKPGTEAKAIDQLLKSSDRTVEFYSGICVVGAGYEHSWSVKTDVRFRTLSEQEVIRYVDQDAPLDCAGSFKVESLGITLFESIRSDDPTALVGLPLISLAHELRSHGFMTP
ncbi:nucleoside triphosphate pyrophosphatase [Reinekea sp. G2M2-21]|uniref:Maf family protein n=1 Tax=Reinekea sp. G2M2-21 TaxID=2788942 RepID=UPI0018AAFAE5|nr:Maf family nucleotide pyrophosphatase [Reinekea sp. G2M2-21]